MHTFKVGDRVTYHGLELALRGSVGTVERLGGRVDMHDPIVHVRFDNGRQKGVRSGRLALAETATEKALREEEFYREYHRRIVAYYEERQKPSTPPVEVRDAGNHGRLLGHLTRRPLGKLQGGRVEVAVPRRVSACGWDRDQNSPLPVLTPNLHRVSFDVSTRRSPCGWESTVYLATSATLEDLQRIETFRLPGETDAQADHRRMRA